MTFFHSKFFPLKLYIPNWNEGPFLLVTFLIGGYLAEEENFLLGIGIKQDR
jgi:hypothetical protein